MSPVKLFFIASVPGAVSMLASALYQVIDGILVGQILGELAFAALNLAMPFVIINFSTGRSDWCRFRSSYFCKSWKKWKQNALIIFLPAPV